MTDQDICLYRPQVGNPDRKGRAIRYRDGAKRVLDIGLALALVPVIAPVVGILWLWVRRDGGPGFFGHARVGQDGRLFSCWKLRTMCSDADQRLRDHLRDDPNAAREWAQSFKLSRDPRITHLGRLLRATSLDELPQLWNVLRGEMSLVGPRPVTKRELMQYQGYDWAYLSCRPGITGLWQVSGRNDVTYDQRIRMDASYLFRMSVWLDMRILLRTLGVIIARTGR